MPPRFIDRLTLVVALLGALIGVLGLRDTPRRAALPESTEVVISPGVPRPVTVDVSVSDEAGKPLEGAAVRIFWESEGRYYLAGNAATKADGHAIIPAVPRGVLWILGRRDGLGRASTQITVARELEHAELALSPASRLSVRVQNQASVPILGATVLVNAEDPLPYAVLSDSNGNAVLELGKAPWELVVSARGYESTTLRGVDGDRVVTLMKLASLRVTVQTEDGSPAPGADVFIVGSSLWPARTAHTEDTGSVRITGLTSGVYDLKATRGSDTSAVLFGFEIGAGTDRELTLTLGPGRMVTGWVAEARGTEWLSVADADVMLVEGGISSFPSRGRSGADGRVTLGPIGSGAATLVATAVGFVAGPATAVSAAATGVTRVAVVRGGRLLGEVVDVRGFPIEGASIEVVGTDFEGMPIAQTPTATRFRRSHFAWALPGPPPLAPAGELGVMPGPVPPIPVGVGPADVATGQEPTAWVSQSTGQFVAWPVSPGRVRALVRHPDYVEGLSAEVALQAGGEGRVRVVLRGGGAIEGRVLDHRGAPAPSARVDLLGVSSALERTVVTSVDGSFAFAAVPEIVILEVHDPSDFGRVLVHRRVEVPEGEEVKLELTLPEPREDLDISVTDERGEAVDGAQITVVSLDPDLPLRRTLFSDSSGHVLESAVQGMRVSITAEAPGFLASTETFASAPKNVVLTLHPGVIVSGAVTAVRGRVAVVGARVTLVTDGYRRSVTTDSEGHFELGRVPPGPVRLEVRHAEYAAKETTAVVERATRDDRPFQLATVDLDEAASVLGRVVDSVGQPVVGARVAVGLAPAYLALGTLPPGVAVTDGAGTFELTGLPAGPQSLEAYSTGAGRGGVEVSLAAGRALENIEIKLTEAPASDDSGGNVSVAMTLMLRQADASHPEIVIEQVAPNSEAERAGLQAGDVIVRIGGVDVSSVVGARRLLDGPLRSDVVLELRRGGQALALSVQRETVRR